MSRIITALDVLPIEPVIPEITEEIIEAANTTSGLGSIVIPAIALVAIAAFGIIFFAKNKKTKSKQIRRLKNERDHQSFHIQSSSNRRG